MTENRITELQSGFNTAFIDSSFNYMFECFFESLKED